MPPHRLIAPVALLLLSAPALAAPELKVTETVLGPVPPGQVYVSPDGKRWAFVREENNRFRVVLDGKEGKAYDWINHKEVAFTADGSKALYIARDGRRSVLVTNTGESPREHFVDHFVTSATGGRVAYAVRNGPRMAGVIDGKETAEHSDVRFDEIGETLAPFIIATDVPGRCVVLDGKPGPVCAEISSVRISPDGRHFAYRALKGNDWVIRIDEKRELPGDVNSVPVFSSDSKRIGYVTSSGGKHTLLIDGQPIAEHGHIRRDFAFSPDGQRLAYITLDAQSCTLFVHADDRSTPIKQLESIDSPRFSPDNQRLAYAARQGGKWMLFIDDKPGASFFSLAANTLTWSSGGHHAACVARRGDKSLLAIDDGETPAYDRIFLPAGVPFDSEHSLVFLAVKEKNLIRVRVELLQ